MRVDQFQQIVERAQDVIIVTEAEPLDEPGPRIIYVNPAFTKLTGYTAEEAIGRSPRFLQRTPSADPETLHEIRGGLESGLGFRGPILNIGKDGSTYWLDMHIFPLRDDTGRITHFAAIERDVTARVMREMELRSAANTDPLTGVFNRRALEHRVLPAWDQDATNSVLMVDVDWFKNVNDGHGHALGDEILRVLAMTLTSIAADSDYPIRLGGDEFLLVMMRTPPSEAMHAAQRLQDELAYRLLAEGMPSVTVSIGVAGGHGDLATIMEDADQALRRAKRSGRNLVTS